MLVVGVKTIILSLNADSLQSMVDSVMFEIVHNDRIRSFAFSNDGKYYLFILSKYSCINYDL